MEELILKKSRHCIGVYANKDFNKGEFIMEFRGRIYKIKDDPRGWNSKNNHYLQIGKDICLGPTKTHDNYINHSCNPNSGVKISDKVLLLAIKDIKKGEEITFDYSTTMEEDNWEMDCSCGNKICRKIIKDFKYLPKKIKQKYIKLGIVPKYILENLGRD